MVSIMSRFLDNLLFQYTVLKKQICFFQVMGINAVFFINKRSQRRGPEDKTNLLIG